MKNKRMLIVLIVVALVIVSWFVKSIISLNDNVSSKNITEEVIENKGEEKQYSVFDVSETEYDFGVIKQSGGIVKKEFDFIYNGEEEIKITGTPTSCACTEAEIDKAIMEKGDRATVTVSFDPNLHEEPKGRFFKTINIMTDPTIENAPEFKIWVEVDLDLGPEAFKLKTHKE